MKIGFTNIKPYLNQLNMFLSLNCILKDFFIKFMHLPRNIWMKMKSSRGEMITWSRQVPQIKA